MRRWKDPELTFGMQGVTAFGLWIFKGVSMNRGGIRSSAAVATGQ
jgi:hypothetical protein